MDYKIENRNGVMLVNPFGDIDQFLNSKKNHEIVNSIMENPESNLILNFSDCISINSSSVKMLYKLINKYNDNEKEIILCNVNTEVEDIFKIADLIDKISIFKTEKDAIESLSN
jgi:anti-anti-sigma factor